MVQPIATATPLVTPDLDLNRRPPTSGNPDKLKRVIVKAEDIVTKREQNFKSPDKRKGIIFLAEDIVAKREASDNIYQGILLVDRPTNRGPSSPCT
jgi:hypothetical protein